MTKIDLHGLTEEEAISAIELALLDYQDGEDIMFVTGNGHVLTRVLEEILHERGISWSYDGKNRGAYILEG